MTQDFSILINLFAQDKIKLDLILGAFEKMTLDEKRSELAWLRMYIEQSKPTKITIDKAINNMPINRSMTPIVILETNEIKHALWKICELPENELEKALITLSVLFRYSDTKRRDTFCKYGCNHEWHNIDKIYYDSSKNKAVKLINWWTKLKKYFD